jgi:hypothetical protein
VHSVLGEGDEKHDASSTLNVQAQVYIPPAATLRAAVPITADTIPPWADKFQQDMQGTVKGLTQQLSSLAAHQKNAANAEKKRLETETRAATRQQKLDAKNAKQMERREKMPVRGGLTKSNNTLGESLFDKLANTAHRDGGNEKLQPVLQRLNGLSKEALFEQFAKLAAEPVVEELHGETNAVRAVYPTTLASEVAASRTTATPLLVKLDGFTINMIGAAAAYSEPVRDPMAMAHIENVAVLAQSLTAMRNPMYHATNESPTVNPSTMALAAKVGYPTRTDASTRNGIAANLRQMLESDDLLLQTLRESVRVHATTGGKAVRTTIKVWITLVGPNGERVRVQALVDTGAEITVCSDRILPASVIQHASKIRLHGAFKGGSSGCTKVVVDLEKDDVRYKPAFSFVSTNLTPHDFVLGMDWIRENYMLLQAAPTPEEESLFFRGIDADGNTVCRE